MTSNTKNTLFRPWDEVVGDGEMSLDEERDDSNYLQVDVKCEREDRHHHHRRNRHHHRHHHHHHHHHHRRHHGHRGQEDEVSGPSLSPSPGSSSRSLRSNVNEAEDEEEEDTLHKLTNLVDRTILGLPNSDNTNSVDSSSSSCSETSFTASSPVIEDDLHSARSAFVPTRLGHPSSTTFGFPGMSYPRQHYETTGASLQLRQELIARQEQHAVAFDHFAAQQGHLALEEAARLLQHHEAMVKQNKKLRPKKFRCPHCDVAFSNNGQLKGHIRIHTGERPFKCDEEGCGKTFTRNEELTRHKRIHSGVRPHACPVCGKRFGRKDHLKKHARTHEMRGPAIYIPAPGPFSFPPAHPPLHPFLFGL